MRFKCTSRCARCAHFILRRGPCSPWHVGYAARGRQHGNVQPCTAAHTLLMSHPRSPDRSGVRVGAPTDAGARAVEASLW